ncbi:hypothetical protein ACFLZG_01740 [Thermodesulfobacteriota bacterium]
MGKNIKKDRLYELNVLDCSKYGLGMIIQQKDLDLLEILNEGDELQDITFYASWTMIKVKGTLRHKTRIEKGKYKGCYLIGIESPDLIKGCKPILH